MSRGWRTDDQGYLLEDASGKFSPIEWARRAVALYHNWGADRIVAEANQGGLMVEQTVRTVDTNVSFKAVHASRGKITRAEPIAALAEQRRIHHVAPFRVGRSVRDLRRRIPQARPIGSTLMYGPSPS